MNNPSGVQFPSSTSQGPPHLRPPPKPIALQKPPRPAHLLGEKSSEIPGAAPQVKVTPPQKPTTPPPSLSPKSAPAGSSGMMSQPSLSLFESSPKSTSDAIAKNDIKKPAVPMSEKPAIHLNERPAVPTSSKPIVVKTVQPKDVKAKLAQSSESGYDIQKEDQSWSKSSEKKSHDGKSHHPKSGKSDEPSMKKSAINIPEPPNYADMDSTEKLEFLDDKLKKLQDLKLQHQKFIEKIERHLKRTEEEKLRVSEQANKEKKSIFGMSLQDTLERDKAEIPRVLKECVEYIKSNNIIDQEGIFRISSSQEKLKAVMDYLDSGHNVSLSRCTVLCGDVHLVPCLLKKYLSLLPVPLVPFECYTTFIACYPLDALCRLKKFKDIIAMFIPRQNWIVLRYLLEFLREVAAHSSQNRMIVSNLGTVFGPLLLRDSEEYDPINECSMVSGITTILIENLDVLFTTPPEK